MTGSRECYPAGRVITHCFIPQPTPPEGVPGHWTSVAGVTIYRDDLFGPEFTGNLFVEDSVYNVIHRMILTPQGTTFRGERAVDEQQSEFLGSADPWFRPATLQTGPDGALWVADMYRFVIEHPEWIVPELTNKLELRRYSDQGRIYRIYPVDKQPRPIPRLDKLDTAGLVAALDHPNGWQRDMAQQMLLWRADKAAVAPLEATGADQPAAVGPAARAVYAGRPGRPAPGDRHPRPGRRASGRPPPRGAAERVAAGRQPAAGRGAAQAGGRSRPASPAAAAVQPGRVARPARRAAAGPAGACGTPTTRT